MNKYILLLIFTTGTLCGNFLLAQSRVDMGVKAGLSIPNLTSGSSDNPISSGYGSRLGVDAAIHAEFHITKHFSIQPQLQYSSQGGKKNGTQAFVVPDNLSPLFPPGQAPPYLYATYKSEARMNYLMLPVFAKYHVDIRDRWSAYIAAGPFASLLLNAHNITRGSSIIYLDKNETQPVVAEPQSFDSKVNIRNDLHHFNAGINGHLGLCYQLAKGNLLLEVGGNYGLIDIQKDKTNGQNKTGAAVVEIGYQFSWKGSK